MKTRATIGFKPQYIEVPTANVVHSNNNFEPSLNEEAFYILNFVGAYFKDKKNRCNPACISNTLLQSLDKVFIKYHDTLL